MDKDALGKAGEEHAWSLLRARGDKLVARNFSCPQGELDLVTWDRDTLVFTEVRLRSNTAFGTPTETITRSKQEKVKRAANWFCAQKLRAKSLPSCRFDVVWVVWRENKVADSGVIVNAFY